MKVLQINRYHHRFGGSETVYFNTANLLQEKGHDVSFFAMDYPDNVASRESKLIPDSHNSASGNLGANVIPSSWQCGVQVV